MRRPLLTGILVLASVALQAQHDKVTLLLLHTADSLPLSFTRLHLLYPPQKTLYLETDAYGYISVPCSQPSDTAEVVIQSTSYESSRLPASYFHAPDTLVLYLAYKPVELDAIIITAYRVSAGTTEMENPAPTVQAAYDSLTAGIWFSAHRGQLHLRASEFKPYLLQRITYPPQALTNQWEETLYFRFTFDRDGHMQQPILLKGRYPCLALEAARVLATIDRVLPESPFDGQYYILPVRFQLR